MDSNKNSLPQCNYCDALKQAEWEFIYGTDPSNHYTYCCTDHIPDMIKSISAGRNGEVKVGYLKKWNTNQFYSEEWNSSWGKFFISSKSIK